MVDQTFLSSRNFRESCAAESHAGSHRARDPSFVTITDMSHAGADRITLLEFAVLQALMDS